MSSVDWDDGQYELTAAALSPSAEVLLDALQVGAGERLLDVGCGTGNLALAAAARGARVTATDPAAGLVDRARARPGAGAVDWRVMADGALPVQPGTFDVIASCFAVIFAPDPEEAGAGLRRAAAPDGRIGLTAWIPEGAIAEAGKLVMGALAPGRSAPRWFAADEAAAYLGRPVEVTRHVLAFTAASPEAWLAEQVAHHPVWRMARRELPAETWARVEAKSVAVLHAHNLDPSGFVVESPYVVVIADRT